MTTCPAGTTTNTATHVCDPPACNGEINGINYFLKANGQQSRKVFKITEIEMDAGSSKIVKKQHPLIPLTTRKYYDGEHAVSLIVNGVEKIKENFRLKLI